jgi:hypothetical protein
LEFDFDGDKENDLLFLQDRGATDAGFPGVLLSAKGGVAHVLYSPPNGYFIDGTFDEDRDKRPDLWLKLLIDGDAEEDCGGYSDPQWSSTFLAHSRPDGSFDMTDKVAAAALTSWCPKRPAKVDSNEDILCALLWHAPGAPMAKKFKRELARCEQEAAEPDDGTCGIERCTHEKWRVELARWKPPLFLR